jgi:hypothetical protein
MTRVKFTVTALILLLLCCSLALLTFQTLGERNPKRDIDLPDWAHSWGQDPNFRNAIDRVVQSVQDQPWLADTARHWLYLPDPSVTRPLALDPDGFKLTFPHTANGGGGGLVIRSSVIVINNSGANATGRILFRKQNGDNWTVATNLGVDNEFSFELLPGEVLRLETDGSGATQVGWVEVLSDVELAGSGTFTVSTTGGAFLSEVGIGDSPRGRDLMIFVDLTEGKDAGFGICNPDPSSTATLSYELRNLDGTMKAKGTDSLGPLEQKAEFVTQTFAGRNLKNFKGVLRILSDGVDVSLITLRTRGVNFTSLDPVEPPEGEEAEEEQTQFFARIGDGVFGTLGFQSSFVLMNNSESDVHFVLYLFKDDGTPLTLTVNGRRESTIGLQVPARGALELITDGSTKPGVVGWAKLFSETPLGGSGTFTISEIAGNTFVSEVGVPASDVTATSSIFVQEKGTISTGVGLTNPNDQALTVKVRLLADATGPTEAGYGPASVVPPVFAGETTIELPPLTHTGLFVSQLFPGIPAVKQRDFTGRLQLESYASLLPDRLETPLTGITLLTRGTKFTSLPLPEFIVNFGPRSTFRPDTHLQGAAPSFCFSTRQLAGEAPFKRAVFTLDKGQVDLTGWQEAQRKGQVSTRILFSYMLPGTMYSADATSTSAEFYGNITFDGESEWDPFAGTISNLPGGGVEFEIITNSVSREPVGGITEADICFDAGLLQLPETASSIVIREDYQSWAIPGGLGDSLESTRFSELQLEKKQAAAPQIQEVEPFRVHAGQAITLRGSGFAATPSGNQVTLSKLKATVLTASPSQLTVRLPHGIIEGPLQVEVGTKTSNIYHLDVAFAPKPVVSTGTSSGGANTTLRVEVPQKKQQLSSSEVTLQPTAGQWIVTGFSVGQQLGTLKIGDADPALLLVDSASGGKLVLHVVEEPGDTPDAVIEISNSANPSFQMITAESSFPAQELLVDTPLMISFTTPIYKLPNADFIFRTGVRSVPERFHPNTTYSISINRSISVN